ncbi:probable polygalacturonase At1g80170 isoform X1 [Juglans microcarpa x Juglans regia]|uniref:probable polygalacturonase At1g80170 isoform X1 n=1 Tax=Juglans microcarpa x Juglans regia TaxID=2249226 RepID=UPI001B7DEFF0|nr:probable polygalacturonase At1g80170 isoform X1 [Juglans microcarpa x Juglans regia]
MTNLRSSSSSTCLNFLLHTFIFLTSNLIYVEGFDSLLQLPQSGSTRIRPISKRVLFLSHFGAKGDGLHDDTKAFKDAWELACSFSRRTRIVIPAGNTFMIHPIDLAGPCQSKVILQISGKIVAPEDPDAWYGMNPRKWIYFHGVNHLTIEGGGTINGMGQKWWAQSCKTNSTNPCQHAPTAITFHRCKYLNVKNLMVVNSQQMHMAFTKCLRVVASNLKVIASAHSPNTDGIHISASKGVELEDSIIRTGDDCISIVSNSSRIRIRNIICGPGHGISIGSLGKSNSWSQVHDVMVDGAFLSNTQNGLRIKTWQGGSGFATDISFQNVLMENVSNPIIIDQYYCDSWLPCANQTLAVKVENISFTHIKGTSATEEAIKFGCSDDSPCEGLYLEDIQLLPSSSGITRSFCWKAHGWSSGLVHPPACFSCSESCIKQEGLLGSAIQSS